LQKILVQNSEENFIHIKTEPLDVDETFVKVVDAVKILESLPSSFEIKKCITNLKEFLGVK